MVQCDYIDYDGFESLLFKDFSAIKNLRKWRCFYLDATAMCWEATEGKAY